MNITSQDILNLVNAYASIRAAKDRGSGYKISDCYGDDILTALSAATKKYTQAINQVGDGEQDE